MNTVDIIEKKVNKQELTYDEINFIVTNFTNKIIPDYQMSSFLMSVVLNGMSPREYTDLTMCMVNTGDIIDLSQIQGVKVDKHSTGGVGDKTTLVLAPLVASLGVPIAKMSGRGLGHTGGTLDKMESITNLNINIHLVNHHI